MNIDLFIPCCIDQYDPKTGFHVLDLLSGLGLEVRYNTKQTCCGEKLYRFGDFDGAQKLGYAFMDHFKDSDYIVSASPSCVSFIRNYFEPLFFNSSYHNEYKHFIKKTYDLAEFLVHIAKKVDFGASLNKKAVLLENKGIGGNYTQRKELNELLSYVNKLQLVEVKNWESLDGVDACFQNLFEPIASEMLREMLAELVSAEAEMIISNCPDSLLYIESYSKKHGIQMEFMHIAEVLNHHE